MSEYFKYFVLESDIHHIVWLDNSNESAEAYKKLLVDILKDFPEDDITTLRVLHDYRQVSFHPFLQVLGSIRWVNSLYPHVVGRIAYIIRDLSIEILMKNMTNISHDQINRRLFKLDEEQAAIEWLLSEEK